jgi:hypothetical protein
MPLGICEAHYAQVSTRFDDDKLQRNPYPCLGTTRIGAIAK